MIADFWLKFKIGENAHAFKCALAVMVHLLLCCAILWRIKKGNNKAVHVDQGSPALLLESY